MSTFTLDVREGVETPEDVDFSDVEFSPQSDYPLPADVSPADLPVAPPPVKPGTGKTSGDDLDALFADFDSALDLGPIDLPVPGRPTLVRFRRLLNPSEMQPWRRAAFDPNSLEGIDVVRLASLGLAALCVGFVSPDGDRLVLDEDGQPLSFASAEVQRRLDVAVPSAKATDERKREAAAATVLAFYPLLAHATTTWQAVLAASGFADLINPVERPSPT